MKSFEVTCLPHSSAKEIGTLNLYIGHSLEGDVTPQVDQGSRNKGIQTTQDQWQARFRARFNEDNQLFVTCPVLDR